MRSLSKQGQLQAHFHSKVIQLSPQLQNGPLDFANSTKPGQECAKKEEGEDSSSPYKPAIWKGCIHTGPVIQ